MLKILFSVVENYQVQWRSRKKIFITQNTWLISMCKVFFPMDFFFLQNGDGIIHVIFKHNFKRIYYRNFQTNIIWENIYYPISTISIFPNLVSSVSMRTLLYPYPQNILKHKNLEIISFTCCYLCAQYIFKLSTLFLSINDFS